MKQSITIKNLSKGYKVKLNDSVCNYKSLREDISLFCKNIWKRQKKEKKKIFWALQDLNLEINQGEIIGIIGHNGSGKSTLLKLLSRISPPTKGRITLHGKIGALLEVGTGFHPELTGKENIFLSGAILGMKKREITKYFDEIVAFAGVERFLETPVKRYSTGMFLRLAFSVMAHLKSEILLVDEVLAVGDLAFQKKCLVQMDKVAKQGRTVVFVSHHMESILSLCPKTLLLEKGKKVMFGESKKVANLYFESLKRPHLDHRNEAKEKSHLHFLNAWIENEENKKTSTLYSKQNYKFMIIFEVTNKMHNKTVNFEIDIFTVSNLYLTKLKLKKTIIALKEVQSYQICCELKNLSLNNGLFYFNLSAIHENGIEDSIKKAAFFNVMPNVVDLNTGVKSVFMHLEHTWK